MVTMLGFIGLGRLGVPIATLLLEAGYPVVCCARGRSELLVARGAVIPGDGSARAVAETASIVVTCLPAPAVVPVFSGEDGLLAADGVLPTVLELSTAAGDTKRWARDQLHRRGGDLLDCPVSGTPAMVEARRAVIYASGDPAAFEGVKDVLTAISPNLAYVGSLGQGTKMKHVANLLAVVHVAAAAEAMAFADRLGLDLNRVAELIASSPAASSGQFVIRAPMIASGRFEGRLVTVRDTRENLSQITAAAARAGVGLPLASAVKRLFDELGESGDDDSDPGKLAWLLGRTGNQPA